MTQMHTDLPTSGSAPSWRGRDAFDDIARSPRASIPIPGRRRIQLATDRVRARPAITPTMAGTIGLTAIGLGMLGLFGNKRVADYFGVRAGRVQMMTLFGLRELISGYALVGDPSKPNWLAFRLVGDAVDIAVLKRAADDVSNPNRGRARMALNAVLAIAAADAVTAQRLANVKRNCD